MSFFQVEVLKEKVCDQVTEWRDKVDNQETLSVEQTNKLKQLESAKGESTEQFVFLSDAIATAERNLDKLYEGIDNLMQISKTDVSPLLQLLGMRKSIYEYLIFLMFCS